MQENNEQLLRIRENKLPILLWAERNVPTIRGRGHISQLLLSVPKLGPLVAADELLPCLAVATPVQLSAHLIPLTRGFPLLCAFPTLQGHTKSKLPHQLSWQQRVNSWHTVALGPLRSVYHLTHGSPDSLWKSLGEIGIPGPLLQQEPRRRFLGWGSGSWSHLGSWERFASELWSPPERKIQLAVFLLGTRVNQKAHSHSLPSPHLSESASITPRPPPWPEKPSQGTGFSQGHIRVGQRWRKWKKQKPKWA